MTTETFASWDAWSSFEGEAIEEGASRELALTIWESYAGMSVRLPVVVRRGRRPGPAVLVTAAVHGDELNGTGAIRHIIMHEPFEVSAGTLVLVPVVNLPAFERHARYLPDRRDLNRSFPGTTSGSLASRYARAFFDQVVRRCDYGIDLHTAAVRRTNFPNVRADMGEPVLADFARAFGAELIVSGKGPKGSLRRAACGVGCRTLILEAGEVWKVEQTVVEYAVRGIRNCLIHLGMCEGEIRRGAFQIETDSTTWVRAETGGFLEFHVAPGELVDKGDLIASSASLTGRDVSELRAPREGVVLGMTTLPAAAPGDAVCHLAFARSRALRRAERAVAGLSEEHLHERMREDLARNVFRPDHTPDSTGS